MIWTILHTYEQLSQRCRPDRYAKLSAERWGRRTGSVR